MGRALSIVWESAISLVRFAAQLPSELDLIVTAIHPRAFDLSTQAVPS